MMKSRTSARVIALALTLVVGFTGMYAEAQTSETIPITTSSETARQLFLEGRVLYEKIRYPDALAKFEQAVAEDPDFVLGHLYLGVLQPSTERTVEEISRAVALSDRASEGERLLVMGVKAAVEGLPQTQGEYYRQLVAAYPNDPHAHYWLATHHYRQQEYDRALEGYGKAVELDPEFFEAYNELGYTHKILEDFTAAEAAFQKVIALIPDEANPYDSYAELLMEMGRFDSSITVYRKALEIDPDFVTTHVGIAADLMFLGRHAQAREEVDKLYAGAHDDGERRQAFLVRAIIYVDEGASDAALAELEKRYEIAQGMDDPTNMAADLVLMGDVLLEAGRPEAASGKYVQAATLIEESDLSPEMKEAAARTDMFNAARVDLARGNTGAAKRKADKFRTTAAMAGNPALMRLSHQLDGMVAFAREDYEDAVEDLALADQNNPYNVYRLAMAHAEMGNSARAQELLDEAAHANLINSLEYAFVREKALAALTSR